MSSMTTTAVLLLLTSSACGHTRGSVPGGAKEGAAQTTVELSTVEGVALKGQATLEEVQDGVRITLKVNDGTPGLRGVHIHEIGDCSDIAGKSMGEHFSPDPSEHGLPSEANHHFGDLGNIAIDDSGKGALEIVVARASLRQSDAYSLLGRAVVMHAGQDTGEGPSGESGAPMACAVIAQR